mmetsp:Transcript_27678/g.58244  ORF Transcript_27678/g.58244 Transcript_27678/m.58244 type:complete len:151 (-) Transcript_27678:126-578(-)
MRVLEPFEGVLTDFEVRQLLSRQAEERKKEEDTKPLPGARRTNNTGCWRAQHDVMMVSEALLQYLDGTRCSALTSESVQELLQAVKPFKLMRAETLMLLNTLPRSLVEVHLVVEECEERLSLEERQRLLALVAKAVEPAADEATGAAGAG